MKTMDSLLHEIAQDLLQRFGNDMSKVAVVFPNKRASLFLNEELARMADGPVWTPAYITISDLFRSHSTLTVADPILLICRLYDSYIQHTGMKSQTLDAFYGWGQLLLADFDDMDKNMVPSEQVFSLVSELHELDDVEYLSEGQREALKHFFNAFSDDHETYMRKRFLELWSKLGDIYASFRESLRDDAMAYEGMLYRDVVEKEELIDEMQYECYCFVGFNMLQKVEQRLFTRLKQAGKALFYWDYDVSYLSDDHEAGYFIKQYLTLFPDARGDKASHDNADKQPEITYLSTPTENMQARYVANWLLENERYKSGARTAIVMCDEKLLQSVITSLPPEVDKINVTTGYPLAQTSVTTLLNLLMEMHLDGKVAGTDKMRLRQVAAVLRHPYACHISPLSQELVTNLLNDRCYYPTREQLSQDEGLRLLFGKETINNQQILHWLQDIVRFIAVNSANAFREVESKENAEAKDSDAPKAHVATGFGRALEEESFFRIYNIITRLLELTEKDILSVDVTTMRRLLMQIIQQTTVPFHGEPVEGVQIMGVLETRCLDFDHILILSCNEGNMPKGEGDTSFIPHSVRKAYEMTTVEHKVGIYSYYYYRMMQRAGDVTVTYNSSTEGLNTGEMSRFMLQMMVEGKRKVNRKVLHSVHATSLKLTVNEIAKTPEVMNLVMKRITEKNVSPSSLSAYLRCPVKYYYSYIAGLKEVNTDDVDEMDKRIFGNVFHKAAQLMYEDIMSADGTVTEDALKFVQKDKRKQEEYVDRAFAEELFNSKSSGGFRPQYNGLHLITKTVILRQLNDLIKYDIRRTPMRMELLEGSIYDSVKVKMHDGCEYDVQIGGQVDRIDSVMGSDGCRHYRVVDYKTGKPIDKPIPTVEDVFNSEKVKDFHADYYLQAMLYSLIYSRKKDAAVAPALLFISQVRKNDYDPVLFIKDEKIDDVRMKETDFVNGLSALLAEICDPGKPFVANFNDRTCKSYCPFYSLCQSV